MIAVQCASVMSSGTYFIVVTVGRVPVLIGAHAVGVRFVHESERAFV